MFGVHNPDQKFAPEIINSPTSLEYCRCT